MNTEPENFEALQKLVALKRHEVPPPGYFDRLPGEILSRIRAEAGQTRPAEAPAGWFQQLWALFDARPILAGAFGVTVCGLVLGGVIYSQQTEANAFAAEPNLNSKWVMPTELAGASIPVNPAASQPGLPDATPQNGLVPPGESLFNQVQILSQQPSTATVNFNLSGN
ncbi:MAG TPA: hypothetical protein VL527_07205 [Dongiaceae bacterium]|jgi:hypothetical protein|nr:hypothetical protein [Dongiaceae bacterium]